jgi:hypothetical protein
VNDPKTNAPVTLWVWASPSGHTHEFAPFVPKGEGTVNPPFIGYEPVQYVKVGHPSMLPVQMQALDVMNVERIRARLDRTLSGHEDTYTMLGYVDLLTNQALNDDSTIKRYTDLHQEDQLELDRLRAENTRLDVMFTVHEDTISKLRETIDRLSITLAKHGE